MTDTRDTGSTRAAPDGEQKPWQIEIEPVTVIERDREVSTHPAFGNIQVSRVTGSGVVLHGSDFQHHATIRIAIHEAHEVRSLSNTWHFDGGRLPLVEFEMSEAQFVAMVSSAGIGAGTPVTLRYANGKHRERIKLVEHTTEKFSRELREDLAGARDAIDKAIESINEGGSAKQRKAAIEALNKAQRALDDSAPFVTSQFDAHMDTVAERAKVEAHALLMRTIQSAGLSQLAIADHSRQERGE